MDVLEALKKEIEGHDYDLLTPTQRTCIHADHDPHWVSLCWKADVTDFIKEYPEAPESKSVDEFAQKMISRIEPGGEPVLTKYVFIGEGIDMTGDHCTYKASTDNITPWDEMGLLKFALSNCDAKVVTRRMKTEGIV